MATGGFVCACLLAGCGASHHAGRSSKPRQLPAGERTHLVDVLNGVLAADQRAIFAYTIFGPLLNHRAQRADGRFLGDEDTHAGVLRALIVHAGASPHQRRASYALGSPRGPRAVLRLLAGLEREQIATLLDAIPRVPSASVRTVLASILADNAEHLAVLQSFLGAAPAQQAFVGGAAPTSRASHPAILRRLSAVELLVASIDERALASNHLSRALRRLLPVLIEHGHEHAQALDRAAAGAPTELVTQPGLPAPVARGGRLAALAWPHTRRGWLDLLAAVQARGEGMFYAALPKLSGSEALLAASIFASDAQQSVALSELESSHVNVADPAALVRGRRRGGW